MIGAGEARLLAGPEETAALGAELAAELRPGEVLGLTGPLGAGKTTLAVGALRALGVQGALVSPTFLGLRRYRDRAGGVVYHVDLYRAADAQWLLGEGVFEDLERGARAVVEWIERDAELAAEAAILVVLAVADGARSARIRRRR